MINLEAQTRELKEMFAAVGIIAQEIRLNISPEGIKVKTVNPANTSMISLDLPKEMFHRYSVDETRSIGMDLWDWNQSLQFENPKAIMQFELEIIKRFKGANETGETYDSFIGIFKSPDGFEERIAIIDPESIRREPKLPGYEITGSAKIETARFKKILKKATGKVRGRKKQRYSSRSQYIKFEINEAGEFNTYYEGDIRKSNSKTTTGNGNEIKGKAKAIYSTDELIYIANTIKDKTIVLEFSNDYPLQITFNILEKGTAKYLLAPRVGDE